MGRALIGNFKGPKGDKGDPGPQGPAGPQGPVGLVNGDGAVEFEDYTSEGAELPAPEDALAAVTSGRSLKSIFSGIRAFCKNMLDSESGSRKMIGDAFSEEQTYVAGEYAIYDNVLYKFTAAKAAGTWNPDVAAPTTIAEVVRELNGNMTDFIIISGGSINIGKLSAGEQGDKNVPINPPEGYKYFTYACGCSSPEISVHKYSNGTPKIIYRAISGVSSALLFYEVTYVKK